MLKSLAVAVAVALAAAVAAGCGAARTPDVPPGLAGACQTRPCQCVLADRPVWSDGEPVAVRWRTSGEASCPDGYELQLRR